MSASVRQQALITANSRSVRVIGRPLGPDGRTLTVTETYGKNTFGLATMADKLPKPTFKRVKAVIEDGARLERADADAIAHAVKEWALEHGCTHFTHWFQPMTGSTAEKHDAFLSTDMDNEGIERFSGDALLQSEPDASSFPSGGMRATFEARGYTAWDPGSPIFIMENPNGNTLCIPSAFVSYTGEALDKKTPLLRSMQAVDAASRTLLEALGQEPTRTVATLGCEQEYFLIDRAYWAARPDLAINGRTVIGAAPPKGQSLDDHYFGAITPRVQAFMQEVEQELYKLGVPAKTRHNEVAPSQFELAPIFAAANVGSDHNQIIMETLRRVALRHDYKVALAEKPFAGLNGSGKHANWSLSTNGENLLEPGANPSENLRFLAVLSSVLIGVFRYNGLLRASVASYGNDFRLGANEAPPAIMSVFLGDLLSSICDAIASDADLPTNPEQAMIELGVSSIPFVAKDSTDRNRTSPVAFTGNKFEFRAVGSQQNPAWPVTVLNTIVAEGMNQLTTWIAEAGGGKDAVFAAIKKAIQESNAIRFEGDGYADAWVTEAEGRGLTNHKKTPDALDELKDDRIVSLFGKHNVLTPAEVTSRYNVHVEQYISAIEIESDCYKMLVDEMILPAALEARTATAGAFMAAKELEELGVSIDTSADEARLMALAGGIASVQSARVALDEALSHIHDGTGHKGKETILPIFDALRAGIDGLEGLVDDELWPLPKYREMLFLV